VRPTTRRVIFLDVENTSRPQHLAHVLDHLALGYQHAIEELVAVANWKVISHDCARLLAQRGAQLVHSAPSTGVRDWSDLRIAVSAGIWLAAAGPGDTIEIVSDDRAFDAVGDVAASLGIGFRRLSYRRMARRDVSEEEVFEPRREPEQEPRGRGRRSRRGRGRSGAHGPARSAHPVAAAVASHAARPAPPALGPPGDGGRGSAEDAHTAPHDELISIVRELVATSRDGSVTLDAVANALKARGFRRPPGSPRLVTRMRRIREVVVSPSGAIRLADAGLSSMQTEDQAFEIGPDEPADAGAGESGGAGTGELGPGAPGSGGRRRRRRRRRGGRRRPPQPAPVA
jgi:hypothetical protein